MSLENCKSFILWGKGGEFFFFFSPGFRFIFHGFFWLNLLAYLTKLLLQSNRKQCFLMKSHGIYKYLLYQSLYFPLAAQISTILSKIQAIGSPKLLLAGLFLLIWKTVLQSLSDNLPDYWNFIAIFKVSVSILWWKVVFSCSQNYNLSLWKMSVKKVKVIRP